MFTHQILSASNSITYSVVLITWFSVEVFYKKMPEDSYALGRDYIAAAR